MNDGYYTPLTLDELIDGLKGIIRESDDLTGQELVTNIQYVSEEDDCDVPPGSIAVFLRQNTLNPDEPKYGTIVLTPYKTKMVM